MLDPDVVEGCAHCLVGAAVYEGAESDLAIAATALARDLVDTQRGQAVAVLDAASREAVDYLDTSDLGTDAFADALRRLTSLQARVRATLADSSAGVQSLPL